MNLDTIKSAADAFGQAVDAERKLYEERADLKLDIRLAERSGDSEELARVKALYEGNLTTWYEAYQKAKAAAEALCAALEISPSTLKSWL